MRFPRSFYVAGFLLSVSACGSEPSDSVAPAPAPQQAVKKATPPGPVVSDTSFQLSLQSQPTYTSGEAGKVQLHLDPRGGYHVNLDYPVRVDLKAGPSVKLDKPSLTKPDAVEFGEERARFEAAFTAEAGRHELLATVDFAVCTKETCLPEKRTLAIVLNVQ